MKKVIFFLLMFSFLKSKAQLVFNQHFVGANQDLYDIRMANTLKGFVCGNKGVMARTIDGGVTWSQLNTGTNKAIWQTYGVVGDTTGASFYAVTDLTQILKTTDYGNSFQFIPTGLPAGAFLTGIQCLSNNYIYACGSNGTHGVFIRSTDGGANWSIVNITRPVFVNKISFSDSLVGYAAASDNTTTNGTIYKTTDGGNTWSLVYVSNQLMVSCHAIDANNCIVVGASGNILVTKDGGTNWTNKSVYNNDIFGIKMVSPTKFYACGGSMSDSAFIYTSIDAGETWKKDYTGYKGRLMQLSINNTGRVFCAGQNGIALRSVGGLSVFESTITNKLTLYPNPAKDVLYVAGMNRVNGVIYIVLSVDGKILKKGVLQNNNISVSDLHKGCYFLQIHDERSGENALRYFEVSE